MLSESPKSASPKPPKKLRYQVRCPGLPLTVYREVVAHLRQINGVDAGLIRQNPEQFSYLQSPVGGLWLQYPADQASWCQAQVEQILSYYGRRYRPWETLKAQVQRGRNA